MQIKLLKNLVEELASVEAAPIVDILFNKKDVNEFLIAKKMDMTINQVRNILYKLSAEGLVSHIRKKDKRKGWYIYYWTLNSEKCLASLERELIKKIENLKHVLGSRESKRFYICKSCDIEVTEETALEHDFTCEECAEVYELANQEKPVRELRLKITKTERELKTINQELEVIREKAEKKRKRRDKKEEKEKAKEKAEKRAKNKAEREKKKKLEEKGKKKVVKKVKKKSGKKKK